MSARGVYTSYLMQCLMSNGQFYLLKPVTLQNWITKQAQKREMVTDRESTNSELTSGSGNYVGNPLGILPGKDRTKKG